MTNAQFLGVHSDSSTCECCGKTNLKRVVSLQLADGTIVNYGTTCASKKFGKQFGSMVEGFAAVAEYINKWDDGTRSADKIAMGVWRQFGFSCQYKSGTFHLQSWAMQSPSYQAQQRAMNDFMALG